ncbi:MAG TPA: carboxypeptidase-like regulatory domain-containing protein [Pyrinomonadaceae bacterium]|nr:carboxypeptidase-like regulatory domain-containing protein [Pyrinomonadaceae bacterium]
MSLTAQTIRTILLALAISLVAFAAPDEVAAQVTSSTPTNQGATVRGVVTYADTGHPLRNARVLLLSNDGLGSTGGNPTDGRGEFVVRGVPAGRFVVVVDAPGILKPREYGRVQKQLIAKFKLSDKRELFTEVVVNGTDTVNVRVSALRGGVITGRVVMEDDQPVAGVNLNLLRSENGKWVVVESAVGDFPFDQKGIKTDSRGVYRIAGLPSGDYAIRAFEGYIPTDGKPIEDGAYTDAALMTVYYPSATSIKDAQPITVIEGSESTGIDIRLPERTPYTISGRVLGPDNDPAAYAQVIVERTDELGDVEDLIQTGATSETDGTWRVTGVSAGDYLITIGGAIRVGTEEEVGYLATVPKSIKVRVNGDVVVPDAKLSAGSAISGRVTVDGKQPQDPYKLFPAIVAVDYENGDARPFNPLRRARRRFATGAEHVNKDGTFQMLAVAPATYWFELPGRADERMYLKAVTRKGVDLLRTPLKVTAGADIEDVVVEIGTDFATIEGEVTFPQDQPVGSAKRTARDLVVVLAPATEATRRIGGGELVMVQPDAQGRFALSCAPGEYFLTALGSAEIKSLPGPINDDYFKHDPKRFTRVKVRGAEKLKGLTIPVGFKN